MDLSIIIVSWNTRDLLAQCLQSVYDTVHGLEFQVFVVDNASSDGSAAMVRERFPQVRLIENTKNVGFARANNQAIREAGGQYILLLNSDARVMGDSVLQMARFMDGRAEVGIVGPPLVFPDGRPQLAWGPLPSLASEVWSLFGLDRLRSSGAWRSDSSQRFLETGWVSGACMMVRRRVIEQVGLLDEEYFMFSEEIDLCYRARKAGWKIIHLPTALAIHVGGGSTGLTAKRILMLYRGKLQYFAKHHGDRARKLLLGAMWAATGLKIIVYTLLRVLSLGRVRRNELCWEVAKGMEAIRV